MDLRGDSPGTHPFGGAVGQDNVLGQSDAEKSAGLQLFLGDDPSKAPEDLQDASFRAFREIAAPKTLRSERIEPAHPATREPPGVQPSTVDAKESEPAVNGDSETPGGRPAGVLEGSGMNLGLMAQLASAPLGCREELRGVFSGPHPGYRSLPVQEILGADNQEVIV